MFSALNTIPKQCQHFNKDYSQNTYKVNPMFEPIKFRLSYLSINNNLVTLISVEQGL